MTRKAYLPSDVQNLIHTFQPRIRPVEREFLMGVENLHAIQQKILRNRAKFQPVIEKSARDLAQAEANFSGLYPYRFTVLISCHCSFFRKYPGPGRSGFR